jgi:hypothetical protein
MPAFSPGARTDGHGYFIQARSLDYESGYFEGLRPERTVSVIIIGTPHTRNSGYFMNDDRNSGGQKAEADIQTCPHCQMVIYMQDWAKAPVQNFCIKCMKPACNTPACQECIPFIQKIEAWANAQLRYIQFSKIAGLDPEPVRSPIITGK